MTPERYTTPERYRRRNSPPCSANKCRDLTRKGNDGQMYVSRRTRPGYFRWFPAGTRAKGAKPKSESGKLSAG